MEKAQNTVNDRDHPRGTVPASSDARCSAVPSPLAIEVEGALRARTAAPRAASTEVGASAAARWALASAPRDTSTDVLDAHHGSSSSPSSIGVADAPSAACVLSAADGSPARRRRAGGCVPDADSVAAPSNASRRLLGLAYRASAQPIDSISSGCAFFVRSPSTAISCARADPGRERGILKSINSKY